MNSFRMSFWIVPDSGRARHALFLARDDEAGEDRDHRAVHRHRNADLVQRDAVEQDLHVLDANRSRRPPCRHRPRRADGRCHSRGGWPGRRRPTRPAARRPAPCGRRRSIPRRWKSPHIAGSSRAGPHTSWPATPRVKGATPGNAAQMRQPRHVGRGIERLDRDPLQRVPGQAVGALRPSVPSRPARPVAACLSVIGSVLPVPVGDHAPGNAAWVSAGPALYRGPRETA